MAVSDTVVALSSGGLPSGVAVVRLSGPAVRSVATRLLGRIPAARVATLMDIRKPDDGQLIDQALVVFFEGPSSFTGEDCLELQCHGGVAVVSAVLAVCTDFDGVRMAEAGEFSRRAFENGKLDLTQAEGLSDLIAAQTEAQRKLAVVQSSGSLRRQLDEWRSRIVRGRALTEAAFDFSEEADVPESLEGPVRTLVAGLIDEMRAALSGGASAEIVRQGFHLVLMGPPNAGKSSLMNALAGRDIAIVAAEAGTTRDVVECSLDVDGMKVRVSDTAGLREGGGSIEVEGMRRGRAAAAGGDMVLWLSPVDAPTSPPDDLNCVVVNTKADLSESTSESLAITTVGSGGLDPLIGLLRERLAAFSPRDGEALFARERQRGLLSQCLAHLEAALEPLPAEIASEELRLAGVALGKLTGRIEPDHLLDVIFSEFCVGK